MRNYKVVVVAMAMVLLAALIYGGFMAVFSDYGPSNNRLLLIQKSYETMPKGAVLFIGDSQTREDIDCILIDSQEVNCYNLGLEGILPVQLLAQTQSIIRAEPKTVVIGISPLFFNEQINKNDDYYFFSTFDQEQLLTEEERTLVQMNYVERALYKRKFILPHFLGFFSAGGSSEQSSLKNPAQFTEAESHDALKEKAATAKEYFSMKNTAERQWAALGILVEELTQANIRVIIVEMPLHPFIREKAADELHSFSFRTATLAEQNNIRHVYAADFYDAEDFIDLTHLNREGRQAFSQSIARGDNDII